MRVILFLVVAFLLSFIGYGYLNSKKELQDPVMIGGDFLLKNQEGAWVSSNDMLNKYTMFFFGFSRCPGVCPTQLGLISTILQELNNKKLQAFFITIDPAYDTVEVLQKFHEQFDDRIQMLTGSEEDIKSVANSYKVYVSSSDKVEEINHSTILYIMGKKGDYIGHINLGDLGPSEAAKEVQSIISNK